MNPEQPQPAPQPTPPPAPQQTPPTPPSPGPAPAPVTPPPGQPVPSAPQPTKKSSALVPIIIIVALIAIFGTTIIFMATRSLRSKNTPTPSPTATESTVSESPSSQISFVTPAEISGWTTDTFAQNGITKYVSTDKTCQVTLVQNKATDNQADPTPDASVSNFIAQLEKVLGKSVEQSPLVPLAVKIDNNSSIQTFTGKTIAYTGTDSVKYTNAVYASASGRYEYMIIPACTTAKWQSSQSQIKALLDKISLTTD